MVEHLRGGIRMITKNHITGKCFRDGVEITATEYDRVLALMKNRPISPAGYGYRFTDKDTWELYELPVEPEVDEEISEAEALEILLGGAV